MLETIFMQIIDMTKAGSVVILFVLAARLLLKRTPKIFSYVLWATVLFRLLCPVSIESNVSLFAAFEAPTEQTAPLRTEGAAQQHVPVTAPPAVFDGTVQETKTQNAVPAAPEKAQTGANFAAYVWLGGVLAMAVYGVASYLHLRRRLLTASPLRENILLADHIPTPFVMGLLRPKIYLPSELGEEEHQYILLHEKHHIRRGDHIIKAVAFAALALHWFNPLAWVAFIFAARDMEMSCDEAVVKKLGGEVLPDYAASLLQLATGRRVIALAPLAFGEGDTKERVRNLARWRRPTLWVIVLCAVLCAVLTACLATDPAGGETAEEAQDGYYLVIGADGVKSIEIKIRGRKTGGVVNADGSLFEKGEKVWLEPLDGVTDLRGVSIAALSVRSEILYHLTIPENAASDEVVNLIAADGWLLVPSDFVPPEDMPKWEDTLLEKYVDVAALPVLDLDLEERYVFDDRVLLMEDSVDNELERVVFENYRASVEKDRGDDISVLSKCVLHRLETLTAEEVKGLDQYTKDGVASAIAGHGLASYAMVLAQVSQRYDPPHDQGDGQFMTRCWLVGKTATDTAYTIYEVFWDVLVNGESSGFPPEETNSETAPATLVSYADVNHNRVNEEVYVRAVEENMLYELTIVEEGEVLYSAQAALAHTGWNTVMLYYEDGKDYLVEYQPSMFQGDGVYRYAVFSLEGGERVVKEESSVDFSLPADKRPDMDAFARRMNILLRNSSVLLSTEQDILVNGWAEASSLPQLYPVRFDVDEIQSAINGERGGEITANAARLPSAPLLLQFSSGAGAWGTLLTMQPDGSFTGVYSDADMGSGAAEYPNGTYYVSEFSGRFEDFEQIGDTMWSMRLSELTYERELGETWVEDGMLHIASEAHGIAGGEEFLLCAPLTPIDDLPAECRTWHPEAYLWRRGERELLQGWAICSVSAGTAFFNEGIFG